MSVENVKAFNQRLTDDETIRDRFAALVDSGPDAMVSYADELGYSFTKDEMLAAANEMQANAINSGELSEEQLESVAGGAIGTITLTILVTGAITITIATALGRR